MAFIATVKINDAFTIPAAYVKATIRSATKDRVIIDLAIWDTIELRNQIGFPMRYLEKTYKNISVSEPQANVIALAYKILEDSGDFPNATSNV